MMISLADHLLSIGAGEARRHCLEAQREALDERLMLALKARADQLMRADIQACQAVVALMFETASVTGNPRDRAMALLAEANVRGIYLGEYSHALAGYDEAAAVYASLGDALGQAIAQIGRLWPLANLGRTQEGLAAGAWAADVLQAHSQWSRLADLLINLGVLHGRLGEDRAALDLFDRAAFLVKTLPEPDGGAWTQPTLARANLNRSIVLRNLGDFAAAVEASQAARAVYVALGQKLSAAKADESLALTHLVMGRTTEALALLDRVAAVFEAEGVTRHAVLVHLFVSECYLLLRRFADVLATVERSVGVFDALGVQFEIGQSLVNAALAHTQLGQTSEALAALVEARRRFVHEASPVWVALTDLVRAEVHLRQGEYASAAEVARDARHVFGSRGLTTREAQARLVEARALAGLDRVAEAESQVRVALALAVETPWLAYEAETLLGRLALQVGRTHAARDAYLRSLAALEQMRGAMMVEFHADFVRDKEEPYQALTDLYLDEGRSAEALAIVERGRSRALVALLSDRLDLSIQACDPADAGLVAELERLREQRHQLYRRLQDPEQAHAGERDAPGHAREQAQRELRAIEKAMTQGWHRLLIRNANYAPQASLWQVRAEPVQPYLADDTVLVEYYFTTHQLLAFVVTRDRVRAYHLGVTPGDVDRSLRPLWLNLKTTRDQVVAGQPPALTRHAQALLRRLYQQLLAPLADDIRTYPRLIIVPHGALHYLPFHALHDGTAYLVQRHVISYLPAASLLRHLGPRPPTLGGRALVMGHSDGGRLPYALDEAQTVSALLGCRVLLEGEATLAALREQGPQCSIIHIAAHGEFRPDHPLFSGLTLGDGPLTALDLFTLRLPASLVTLSACHTGRNVIGGGDELIGLTRGLLYAGAASLLLSHWAVEDHATATLMQTFYRAVVAGAPKADALHQAQREFLDSHAPRYAHPYFWAPFFLSGASGVG